MTTKGYRLALSGVFALALGLAGCAATNQDVVDRMDQQEVETREEVEALKRAVEASYDRERAMAERLRQAEESDVQLRQQVVSLQQELGGLQSKLDAVRREAREVNVGEVEVFRTDRFNAPKTYRAAKANYDNHGYDKALGQFTEILTTAPYSDLADNAQYWIGECYYGLGKFHQALTEFTKVFAYSKTEKDDDSQLKIGRCYMDLGEKDKALLAFQKVLDDYPESEYVGDAQRLMKMLRGR